MKTCSIFPAGLILVAGVLCSMVSAVMAAIIEMIETILLSLKAKIRMEKFSGILSICLT